MKLNGLEFALMNNPVRAALQRRIETPMLIGRTSTLAGKHVLEVGCGRGVGMEILLALGAGQVTGFDLDPKMVDLAQKRLAKYGERARVLMGDAESIELPSGSFDAVVDYGILHHVPGWPVALKEIARVLKPAGMFYFEDILRGFTTPWPMRVLLDHPQATQFSGQEFRSALQSANLCVRVWRQWGEWGIMGHSQKCSP